jgi:hypothetical protein
MTIVDALVLAFVLSLYTGMLFWDIHSRKPAKAKL